MTTLNEDDPPGTTRLILDPNDVQVLTANREHDASSAITRGLAEYLHSLSATIAGTTIRFKKVESVWAAPEEISLFPSAVVLKEGDVTYGDSTFTPYFPDEEIEGFPRAYLISPCELEMICAVEIWATLQRERDRIMAMMEDAIFPVEFMYGFRLELPFYFNARPTFEPTGAAFADTAESAKMRERKVTQRFNVKMPVYRLITGVPKAEGRVRLSLTTTTEALEPSS